MLLCVRSFNVYADVLSLKAFYQKEDVSLDNVIDGDTILLKNGKYVRFIGIDTPEIRKKINGKWIEVWEPFSREAFEFNKRLLIGRKIRLEYDFELKDNYERDLCYVYAGGIFVNEAILKEGLAFPYLRNKKIKHYLKLKTAFLEAVKQKKNLYKNNLKYEKDLKKFLNQEVFFEGVINNIYSGKDLTEIVFDRLIVVTKDVNKKLKKGDYLYIYGKLIQKQGRFLLIADPKKIFYLD